MTPSRDNFKYFVTCWGKKCQKCPLVVEFWTKLWWCGAFWWQNSGVYELPSGGEKNAAGCDFFLGKTLHSCVHGTVQTSFQISMKLYGIMHWWSLMNWLDFGEFDLISKSPGLNKSDCGIWVTVAQFLLRIATSNLVWQPSLVSYMKLLRFGQSTWISSVLGHCNQISAWGCHIPVYC